jgi:hypothetical protein
MFCAGQPGGAPPLPGVGGAGAGAGGLCFGAGGAGRGFGAGAGTAFTVKATNCVSVIGPLNSCISARVIPSSPSVRRPLFGVADAGPCHVPGSW